MVLLNSTKENDGIDHVSERNNHFDSGDYASDTFNMSTSYH